MYKQALKLANKYHHRQCRRGSCVPYITHPLRVASHFNDDFRKTIAILHDVVEDTNMTIELLSQMFPENIVRVVDLLTKQEGEDHFKYIKRLSVDEVAAEIKIMDIVDNLTDSLCVQPESMIERYRKSLDMLINK